MLVDVQDKSHLKVTAQGGPAEVRDPAGLLVARLEPGKALSFSVQARRKVQARHHCSKIQPPRLRGKPHPRQARN